MGPARAQTGFTLAELMITIVILGLVTFFAVPGLQNYIEQNRVKTGAQAIFTSLLYARSEAVKRNAEVYVYPNGSWQNGWVVTSQAGKSYSDCQSDQTNCLRMQQELSGISVDTSATDVTYRGNGRISSTATFSVCDSEGDASIRRRRVDIDLTGRPTIDYEGTC